MVPAHRVTKGADGKSREQRQISSGTTGGGWRRNGGKVKQSKQGDPPWVCRGRDSRSSLPHRATHASALAAAGVRVSIRALKRGNARRAKGHRKIDRERTNNLEEPPDLMEPTTRRTAPRFSGEDLAQWAWTEPSVWTNSMLATLQACSVRAGKWHSLIDKVYSQANLYSAYREVAANRGAPGVDNITIEDFTANLLRNIGKLEQQLRDGTYRPQSIKRVHIPKPGTHETRPLAPLLERWPTVRDRVVQNALRHVLEPILERHFAAHSYGFRPHRGCKDALRRVDGLVKQGFKYTVDVDLKSYFDTIPHDRLIAELRKYVADNRVIGLVE